MQDVLTCIQVMEILQCSKSKAYEIILELNINDKIKVPFNQPIKIKTGDF